LAQRFLRQESTAEQESLKLPRAKTA